jgi:hypothetical protein
MSSIYFYFQAKENDNGKLGIISNELFIENQRL